VTEPIVVRMNELAFQRWGHGPGIGPIGRTVTTEVCERISDGISKLIGCSIEWTLLYD
jgi:hypothetical protein